jgi:hypothetical protein
MRDDEFIAVIPKNAREEIRVKLHRFHGRPLVDVRTYAPYHSTGKMGQTLEGISLGTQRLSELRVALEKAEALLRS